MTCAPHHFPRIPPTEELSRRFWSGWRDFLLSGYLSLTQEGFVGLLKLAISVILL